MCQIILLHYIILHILFYYMDRIWQKCNIKVGVEVSRFYCVKHFVFCVVFVFCMKRAIQIKFD